MNIIIVDGYNMIGAWEHLREKKRRSLEEAREGLINDLSDYGPINKCRVIIVFDAYDVKGLEKKLKKHSLEVVFTRENETADEYIEKLVQDLKRRDRKIWVATSDSVQQWQIFGKGALRKPAHELLQDIREAQKEVKERVRMIDNSRPINHIQVDSELKNILEEMRRRKK